MPPNLKMYFQLNHGDISASNFDRGEKHSRKLTAKSSENRPGPKRKLIFQPPFLRSYCWWTKSCTSWDIYIYKTLKKNWFSFHFNWCRISSINSMLVWCFFSLPGLVPIFCWCLFGAGPSSLGRPLKPHLLNFTCKCPNRSHNIEPILHVLQDSIGFLSFLLGQDHPN